MLYNLQLLSKVNKDFEGKPVDDISIEYAKDFFNFEGGGDEDENGDNNANNDDVDNEQLMSMIFNSFPNFANTEGMTEEQLNQRNGFINVILESLRE